MVGLGSRGSRGWWGQGGRGGWRIRVRGWWDLGGVGVKGVVGGQGDGDS